MGLIMTISQKPFTDCPFFLIQPEKTFQDEVTENCHWRRQWQPTPVLLPGKSHGPGSLMGCHLWGCIESGTTEASQQQQRIRASLVDRGAWQAAVHGVTRSRAQLHFHFSLSCTGEGNGNPLQCSCLENPRDGGAWWAVIYGVAQSRT